MVFKRQQQFEINWLWWGKEINPFYAVCFFLSIFATVSISTSFLGPMYVLNFDCYRAESLEAKFLLISFWREFFFGFRIYCENLSIFIAFRKNFSQQLFSWWNSRFFFIDRVFIQFSRMDYWEKEKTFLLFTVIWA